MTYAFPGHGGRGFIAADIRPDGVYVDATAGLGGHTGLIAQRLTTGTVIANDRDARIARTGARQYRALGGANPLSPGDVWRPALDHRGRRISKGGWAAGGPGSKPLSVSRCAAPGFLVLDRWAVGYADVTRYRHDGGRLSQLYSRKGYRRPDLSVRRRKGVAEDSQSNRPRTAHTKAHCIWPM